MCGTNQTGMTTAYPPYAQQQLFQSPTGGGSAPTKAPSQVAGMSGGPVQQSPVQQSPVQSGPPMKGAPQKVTQGGGPVQYIPPAPEQPKKFVLIPRPQPEQVDEPRKRRKHGHTGGGGGPVIEHKRPVSIIRAQQNVGKDIVNREPREMPTNYRKNRTTDSGDKPKLKNDPRDRDRDYGTSPSGHKKTAPGSRNKSSKNDD